MRIITSVSGFKSQRSLVNSTLWKPVQNRAKSIVIITAASAAAVPAAMSVIR